MDSAADRSGKHATAAREHTVAETDAGPTDKIVQHARKQVIVAVLENRQSRTKECARRAEGSREATTEETMTCDSCGMHIVPQ